MAEDAGETAASFGEADFTLADPERALAIAYAPAGLRDDLTALFALDERLGAIVGTTSEPMIGLMRLAWWRERIEGLGSGPAPAEPLLTAMGGLVARGADPATLAAMEGGWAALLDGEMDADAIARHGRERGASLFRAAAALLGARDEGLAGAGEGWALADLAHRHSDPAVRAGAGARAVAVLAPLAGRRWSRAARPLAALAVLARADAGAVAVPRRQGSPGRLLRMLALRVTGR